MTYYPPFDKFSLYDEDVLTTTSNSSSPILTFNTKKK